MNEIYALRVLGLAMVFFSFILILQTKLSNVFVGVNVAALLIVITAYLFYLIRLIKRK